MATSLMNEQQVWFVAEHIVDDPSIRAGK